MKNFLLLFSEKFNWEDAELVRPLHRSRKPILQFLFKKQFVKNFLKNFLKTTWEQWLNKSYPLAYNVKKLDYEKMEEGIAKQKKKKAKQSNKRKAGRFLRKYLCFQILLKKH